MNYLRVDESGNKEFFNFDFLAGAADTTPDAMVFNDVSNAEPGVQVESNEITISGITAAASIQLSGSSVGGEFSIDGAGYTSAPTTINNGQTLRLRNTSAGFDGSIFTEVDVGGVLGSFTLSTRSQDSDPNAFGFTDQTGVEPSTLTESNAITLSGFDFASISVDVGEYRINAGSYTSSPGTVFDGDSVQLRHTSSASYSTAIDQTLTVGAIQDTFTTTTRAEDTVPDAFSFADQNDVALSAVIESDVITPQGFDSASLSITGGEYRLDGGTYTSAPGTITPGQTVQVRHTSSGSNSTAANTQLTIGGVSDTFTSTTIAPNVAPTITGSAAVTTPENQLNIAQYTIDNRDGELPTLSGADAGLFDIDLISGDLFQFAWASSPDFEVLGAGPHNVSIDIDDTFNALVSQAVAVTLADVDEIKPQPVISYAGGIITGPIVVDINTGDDSVNFGEPDIVVVGASFSDFTGADSDYSINDLTPPADSVGNITIDINADVYTDAAGNDNLPATQLVIPYDTRPPSIVSINGGNPVAPGSTVDIVTIKAGVVEGVARLFRNNTHYPLTVVSWADELVRVTFPLGMPAANDYQLQLLFG